VLPLRLAGVTGALPGLAPTFLLLFTLLVDGYTEDVHQQELVDFYELLTANGAVPIAEQAFPPAMVAVSLFFHLLHLVTSFLSALPGLATTPEFFIRPQRST
jgi:hypothetical protein